MDPQYTETFGPLEDPIDLEEFHVHTRAAEFVQLMQDYDVSEVAAALSVCTTNDDVQNLMQVVLQLIAKKAT